MGVKFEQPKLTIHVNPATIDHDLFRLPAGWKSERHCAQPGRFIVGRALLIERLPFGAIHETFEDGRPANPPSAPGATDR